VIEAQVEVGGGPLHTQFDNRGNAYTSLFVESAGRQVDARPPRPAWPRSDAFKLVDKIPVHYNIGHLVTAHGDTVDPTASTWWRSTSGRSTGTRRSGPCTRRTSS
jgi:nitrous-oxide reductase